MRGTLCSTLLLPILLLSGCSSSNPAIKTQFVDRPVIQTVHCLKQEDVPKRPEPLATSAAVPEDLETALALSLSKLSEWSRFGNKIDVIIKNCVE